MEKSINILKNAVDSCDLEKVKEALKEATLDDINHRIHSSHEGWLFHNITLLDDAIINCPDSIANELIDHGADIRTKDEYGRTSLINAIIHEKDPIAQKIISVILSKGAKQKLPKKSVDEYISKEISVKDNYNKSALYYSLRYGRFEVTQTLLRYHAKVEKEDIELAHSKDNQEIVTLLETEFNAQRNTTEAAALNTIEPDIKSIMESIRNTNSSNGIVDLRNNAAENTTAATISRGATQNTTNVLTSDSTLVISNSSNFNQTDVSHTQDHGNGLTTGILAGIFIAVVIAGAVGCYYAAKRWYSSRGHNIWYQGARYSSVEEEVPSTLDQSRLQFVDQSIKHEFIT